MNTLALVAIISILIEPIDFQYSYHWEGYVPNVVEDDLSHSKRSDYGTLTGDVQNWAAIIQNYIIQVNIIFELFLF